MDIQTKDGIVLRGIPDGTPEDAIKARIALIREGRQSQNAAVSQEASAPISMDQEPPALEGAPVYQDATPSTGMSWSDVASQAMKNAPASAKQFISDLTAIVREPVETVKAIGNLGLGVMMKAVPGKQESEQYADAVGQFLVDRYGGVEQVKRTMATDPVGFASDVSMILTGSATVAARAPGLAGQTARAVGSVGRAIDPLNVALQTAGKGAEYVGKVAAPIFGTTTGAGARAVSEAAQAGYAGGQQGRAFTEQMRGIAPVEDVVTDTTTALDRMKQDRASTYRAGMAGVSADKTIMDFTSIDKAIDKVASVGVYKGQTINPTAGKAMESIRKTVEDWKMLDPAEFHTPEGLDALKQKIYAIGKTYDPLTEKAARVVADQTYSAIKNEIVKQAPDYANVMKDYERASDLIHDIEKTLSVNPKADVDTTIRKLQSVMRNNANTNYGRRVDLAETMAARGAPDLMPRLAGQALSSTTPRGLQGAGTALGGLGMGAGIVSGTVNPLALPSLLATSPRTVGEAAYYGGRAVGGLSDVGGRLSNILRGAGMTPRGVGVGAYQAGRLSRALQEQ